MSTENEEPGIFSALDERAAEVDDGTGTGGTPPADPSAPAPEPSWAPTPEEPGASDHGNDDEIAAAANRIGSSAPGRTARPPLDDSRFDLTARERRDIDLWVDAGMIAVEEMGREAVDAIRERNRTRYRTMIDDHRSGRGPAALAEIVAGRAGNPSPTNPDVIDAPPADTTQLSLAAPPVRGEDVVPPVNAPRGEEIAAGNLRVQGAPPVPRTATQPAAPVPAPAGNTSGDGGDSSSDSGRSRWNPANWLGRTP